MNSCSAAGPTKSPESKSTLAVSSDNDQRSSSKVMLNLSGGSDLKMSGQSSCSVATTIHVISEVHSVEVVHKSERFTMYHHDSIRDVEHPISNVEHSIIRTVSSSGIHHEARNCVTSDYSSAGSDFYAGRNSELLMAPWSRLRFSDFTASSLLRSYHRRHESRPESSAVTNPKVITVPPKRNNTCDRQCPVSSRLKNWAPSSAAAASSESDLKGKCKPMPEDGLHYEQNSHESVPSADAHSEQIYDGLPKVVMALTKQCGGNNEMREQENYQRLKEGKQTPNIMLQDYFLQNCRTRTCYNRFQQGWNSNQPPANKVLHSSKVGLFTVAFGNRNIYWNITHTYT